MGPSLVHINFGRGKRAKKAPTPCPFFRYAKNEDGTRRRVYCLCITEYLCDWPGCNAPFCPDHRLNLGPDLDVCPTHNHQRGLFSRLLTYEETTP
jgi:hypothetical protein